MFTFAMTLPFSEQPYPLLSWLLAIAAVIILGIAKSGFGSGVGIIAVPLFVFAFGDPTRAMGALLPMLLAADILSVIHHHDHVDRHNLRVLTPGTLAGILIGAIALFVLIGRPHLGWMPDAWTGSVAGGGGQTHANIKDAAKQKMEMVIGVICLLYVVGDQIKARYAPQMKLKATWLSGSITGFLAGVVSTIAHAAGPILTIFFLGQHLEKRRFVGTAVAFTLIFNTVKLLPYFLLGLLVPDTLWPGLFLLPAVPLGTYLGLVMHRRMSDTVFRWSILIITAISGVQMIWGLDPIKLLHEAMSR
ncbi:MAG: sulfite exporter TauE/SafE family protein [Phycisphaeraceae bacterium]